MSSKGEFGFIDFIKEHFKAPDGVMGIGDDCAVLPIWPIRSYPAWQWRKMENMPGVTFPTDSGELLVSTDLLMEGVHFLREESSPEDVGWKAAAVNLSDIAAMGGVPIATFLSIALPKDAQEEWAERFIKGYAEISDLFDVPLLGGDTTSSLRDLAINVCVLGRCPSGKAIKRSGARPGDVIYVTGPLGDSAAGLQAILNNLERTEDVATLIHRHKRPIPRLRAGTDLIDTGVVGAMMDISDGIASDLRHILKASGVGAVVELDKLPLSEELMKVCQEQNWNAYELATGGGEDFELLFTAPAGMEKRTDIITVYPIGRIVEGSEIQWMKDGVRSDFDTTGYKHF